MPSIADAIGLNYQGAEANISTPGRAGHSLKALSVSFQIPQPIFREPAADIGTMLSKQGSGFPGDNIDVYA